MTGTSLLPVATVLVPALAIAPIYGFRNSPNRREATTLIAALATVGLVASLVPAALEGRGLVTHLGTFASVPVAFRADALGVLFALLAASLWLVTSVYSVGYMRSLDEHGQTRYYAAFAASIAATLGVAFGATLLTLFVCYELLTLATYPLVTHAETEAARRAGRRYVLYGLSGGVAIFAGLVLLTTAAGPTVFTPGGVPAVESLSPDLARAVFGLLVAGFGVKAAVVPLHTWLPEAMVAPTPVSGLLHAVAVVKSGVFGIARVVLFVFGPDATRDLGVALPLAVVAVVTILYTGLVALRQDKLKRGIAYSTVSQLGYIVLGLALLTPAAVFGALLHVVAHAVMKLTVFLSVGAIYVETGREYVSQLDGVGRRLPLTITGFGIAAAGLVGMPAVAGFVSKWYLMLGTVQSEYPILVAAFLGAGLLKLLFFWPIVLRACYADGDSSSLDFVGETTNDGGGHHVASGHRPDGGFEREDPNDEGRLGEQNGDDLVGEQNGEGPRSRSTWDAETTVLLLGPILAAVLGAVVLGVRPESLPFFDLADHVVTEVFGT